VNREGPGTDDQVNGRGLHKAEWRRGLQFHRIFSRLCLSAQTTPVRRDKLRQILTLLKNGKALLPVHSEYSLREAKWARGTGGHGNTNRKF